LPLFHYALKPGGLLMLGLSESVGTFTDLFMPVDERQRIYERRPVPSGIHFDVDLHQLGALAEWALPDRVGRKDVISGVDIAKEADRVVLNKYAPAGVVIDEQMTILQFRGHTGAYLEPAPGVANLNLLSMLREGLLVEVRSAVAQAKAQGIPVRREHLLVRDGK